MKKLKLDNLKVKSFVTALEEEKAHTVKGGAPEKSVEDICYYTADGCNEESLVGACIPKTEYLSCICEEM
jgi:hypothetical protein